MGDGEKHDGTSQDHTNRFGSRPGGDDLRRLQHDWWGLDPGRHGLARGHDGSGERNAVHGRFAVDRLDGWRRSARPARAFRPMVPAASRAWRLDPVATAASNNPALSTLVTAVGAAGLGDTLNSDRGHHGLRADERRFAAIDKATLDAALADPKGLLTTVLTYHVVPGRLTPESWPVRTRRSRAGRSKSPAAVRTSPSTARPRSSAATSRPPTPRSTSSTACSSRRRADRVGSFLGGRSERLRSEAPPSIGWRGPRASLSPTVRSAQLPGRRPRPRRGQRGRRRGRRPRRGR